jgi:hypothetical protein
MALKGDYVAPRLQYGYRLNQTSSHRAVSNPMAAIAVFRFGWWDQNSGKYTVSSRFATLNTIKTLSGRNIEESRRLVDTSELDRNGFYQTPTIPTQEPDSAVPELSG